MRFFHRPRFWMSAAYFGFYAGIACWAPYIVLYYQQLGLSGSQIGILNAITPLGMAFLAPVWGSLADTYNAHRLILRIALLTTATIALLLTGVSGFWQVAPLILVLALFGTTASPLLDSYGVTLGAQQGGSFGQMRVWGSIGYTLVVWAIGFAMGADVSQLFLLAYAAALLGTFSTTFGLPARGVAQRRHRWHGAAEMLRRPDVRVILLTVFLLAISTNGVFALFAIYIKALGGSTTLLGASSALAAISEFPVLFLGSWLTERLGSRRMMIVALSVYSVRILLYTLIPSAPWVLGVQLLHGASFGLYLMASTSLVYQLVGPERAATAQGLLASAMAFGQMTGSLIGGFLLDRVGIFVIYRYSAAVSTLALVVFVLALRRTSRPASVTAQPVAEHPAGQ